MKRAKSICRHTNCSALIPAPGYCEQHKQDKGERFKGLAKAPGSRAFYGSHAWRKTAAAYRQDNPLCDEHKRRGLIVKGDLVDHIIERGVLESEGLDPLDWQYLRTLCHSCHNKKLGERQRKIERRY